MPRGVDGLPKLFLTRVAATLIIHLDVDGAPLQVPVRWTVALHRVEGPKGYRAVMTNPLMRLRITPSPNRLRMASVALAVASSSDGGYLASISVRRGVP